MEMKMEMETTAGKKSKKEEKEKEKEIFDLKSPQSLVFGLLSLRCYPSCCWCCCYALDFQPNERTTD